MDRNQGRRHDEQGETNKLSDGRDKLPASCGNGKKGCDQNTMWLIGPAAGRISSSDGSEANNR